MRGSSAQGLVRVWAHVRPDPLMNPDFRDVKCIVSNLILITCETSLTVMKRCLEDIVEVLDRVESNGNPCHSASNFALDLRFPEDNTGIDR